jgi:hypothetical protein
VGGSGKEIEEESKGSEMESSMCLCSDFTCIHDGTVICHATSVKKIQEYNVATIQRQIYSYIVGRLKLIIKQA